MFFSDMKEAYTQTIPLPEVTMILFQLVLSYMYEDSVSLENLDIQTLQKLILLASEYNLVRLIQLCEKQLSHHVTIQNVIELFQFCEEVQVVDQLKELCMFLIQQEHYILSLTGQLLQLPPEMRQQVSKKSGKKTLI